MNPLCVKQSVSFLRYGIMGSALMLLSACAVYDPEPVAYEPGPIYGPPVYYQAYPYYAPPPPVVSFGFGGGGGYYGHGGYYGRGRW